jgi:flagellar L-ring protein precursor FlgH
MKTMSKSASNLFALALILALVAVRPLTAAASGSLWPAAGQPGRNMVSDRKAAVAGDILTIVIAESAVAQSTQNKQSTRESSIEDAVERFLFSAATSGLGTHNGELPSTSILGKSGYSGGGAVNNSQSLSSRAAVLVSDVLPNGNLVIEGVRVVTFSGETQYVVLHGLVRRDDIARDNTVLSTNIAEARVEFHTEGSLTDAQKRGWLAKVYEKLRPF